LTPAQPDAAAARRLNSLLRVSAYDAIAQLPVTVEGYDLEANDREYSPEFTRGSTIVRLRGAGTDGIGEDVVYDVLDHIAHRDAGAVHDLSGPGTLGELCELLGELDLFPGAPPVREPSRHYRRWAFESAALDLALRQAGEPLWRVVGREPRPLNFVCSTRLSMFGADPPRSTTEPVRGRLEKYPTLRFKLDPENDWDDALIAELKELAPVDILDLKGLYRGTPVDVETDPVLYREVAAAFPEAYLEDPDINDETRPVLEPHMDRVTWDAPLHSLTDVRDLEHKPPAINSKPSRFGSLRELMSVYEYCEAQGIAVYGGGQGELGVGRQQIQYLASVFHPETPNDVAPSGYNDPGVPGGLPASPMEPAPAEAGFRWAQ
jgi:L-alanine-DL-glutamate epimerase-like enolase superfamily enzyme